MGNLRIEIDLPEETRNEIRNLESDSMRNAYGAILYRVDEREMAFKSSLASKVFATRLALKLPPL